MYRDPLNTRNNLVSKPSSNLGVGGGEGSDATVTALILCLLLNIKLLSRIGPSFNHLVVLFLILLSITLIRCFTYLTKTKNSHETSS